MRKITTAGIAAIATLGITSPAHAWDGLKAEVDVDCTDVYAVITNEGDGVGNARLIYHLDHGPEQVKPFGEARTLSIHNIVPKDGKPHRIYAKVVDHDGDWVAEAKADELVCTVPAPPAPEPVVVPVPEPAAPVAAVPVAVPVVNQTPQKPRLRVPSEVCVPKRFRIAGPRVTSAVGSTVNTFTVDAPKSAGKGVWKLDKQKRGTGRKIVLRSNQIGKVRNGYIVVSTLRGKHTLTWTGADECGGKTTVRFRLFNNDPQPAGTRIRA